MVSIIIPYYNRPVKLNRCLISVLNQTYQDFEILLVDDCSTVPLILNCDNRITIYRNRENLGPGMSRNVGLENARGEYIAFLDSDDYWNPNFLEICLKHFKKEGEISMVFTNGYEVDEAEDIVQIRRDSVEVANSILPQILKGSRQWGTGGCLWKKSHLENVKWQPYTCWEDYAFDIDVAINCNNIFGVNDCLVYYDSSGADKLSKRNWEQTLSEKSKSILHISKALRDSYFYDDSQIKAGISIQLINNIIAIIETKSKNNKLVSTIRKELEKWIGFNLALYIKYLNLFPTDLQLQILRYLKNKIRKTSS